MLVGCGQPKPELLNGATMGTTYSIKLYNVPSDMDAEQLHQEVDDLLENINGSMSTYLSESELSRFNRSPLNEWQVISAGLFNVLRFGQDLCLLTDGAFDVTVGQLVNQWGFGPEDRAGIPGDKSLTVMKQNMGCDAFALDDKDSHAKRLKPAVIDLSAIAKGYAVDIISNYLVLSGVDDYMIEIGGEVKTSGRKVDGSDWRIAIEAPDILERKVFAVVNANDIGMATSGDYRNFFEEEGQRYSHTIDPRTGVPVNHTLGSVTVLHPSVMQADGFATAINVMGPEQGYEFALQYDIAAYLIHYADNELIAQYTPLFTPYLAKAP